MSPIATLKRLVARKFSPYTVGVVRAVVGLAALLQVRETVLGLKALAEPGILRLPRAEWVRLLSSDGLKVYSAVWMLLAIAFMLGWHTRVAGVGLCFILGYSLIVDRQMYQNHVYLLFLMCLLLVLADSGAAVSLDSRRRGRPPTVPAWPVYLMKVQVTLIYAFAALSKLNNDYLSGSVINVRIASDLGFDGGKRPFALLLVAIAGISVMVELFLAVGLWLQRLRPYAVTAGVAFHSCIFFAIGGPGLVVFGMTMIASYALFAQPVPAESPAMEAIPAKRPVSA